MPPHDTHSAARESSDELTLYLSQSGSQTWDTSCFVEDEWDDFCEGYLSEFDKVELNEEARIREAGHAW